MVRLLYNDVTYPDRRHGVSIDGLFRGDRSDGAYKRNKLGIKKAGTIYQRKEMRRTSDKFNRQAYCWKREKIQPKFTRGNKIWRNNADIILNHTLKSSFLSASMNNSKNFKPVKPKNNAKYGMKKKYVHFISHFKIFCLLEETSKNRPKKIPCSYRRKYWFPRIKYGIPKWRRSSKRGKTRAADPRPSAPQSAWSPHWARPCWRTACRTSSPNGCPNAERTVESIPPARYYGHSSRQNDDYYFSWQSQCVCCYYYCLALSWSCWNNDTALAATASWIHNFP